MVRVPEAATIIIGGGLSPQGLGEEQQVAWQRHFLGTMIKLEDSFLAMAEAELRELQQARGSDTPPLVLVCDRGTMDVAAHLSESAWAELLRQTGNTDEALRDRYNTYCYHKKDIIHSLSMFIAGAMKAYCIWHLWRPQRSFNIQLRITLHAHWGLLGHASLMLGAKSSGSLIRDLWKYTTSQPFKVNSINLRALLIVHSEKMDSAVENVADMVRHIAPPPVNTRLLITAEPFGFGEYFMRGRKLILPPRHRPVGGNVCDLSSSP